MPEVGRWNEHIFSVSPNVIRSFSDLSIRGAADTEDKSTGNQKYVSYKNGKAAEISMTALLSALTGNDVREEAMAFVDEARRGCAGYFYLDGKKLVTCPLMLVEASVSETEISSANQWIGCKVKLTFKQSGKYDDESGGSGGSGGGSGGKKGGGSSSSNGLLDGAVIGAVNGALAAIKKMTGDQSPTMAQEYINQKTAAIGKKQSAATKRNARNYMGKLVSTAKDR